MKITILCISDSDKHFSSAISEYTKRLGKAVDILDLKPVKHGTKEQIITKETDLIIQKIEKRKAKGDKIYLLSKDGEFLDTLQCTKKLQKSKNLGISISIILGGPYGLDEKKLQPLTDGSISLGSHTMPHGLAKLVLLEQIYRAQMIMDGREYHY